MNTLYVILFTLVAYANATNESNISMLEAAGNIRNKCYICDDCPQPFNRFNLSVLESLSSTGWCYKMGETDSILGIYIRGAADGCLCSSNGCKWKEIAGYYYQQYVCCCNTILCNTGVSKSQSIVAVLSTAFITTIIAFKSFYQY